LSHGTKSDWPYFARWHYRSHYLGLTRKLILLWHRDEPIGICVFVSPPISLKLRNQFFGRSGRWSRAALQALNRQLVLLQRVVIHPSYRGAGIAAGFVRRSCELCPYPWVETLTQMGHIHPFFEKAGFTRVGICVPQNRDRRTHSSIYGGNRRHAGQGLLTRETFEKSRFAHPVYYVFDNRPNARAAALGDAGARAAIIAESGTGAEEY
jgi:GNAT superfamily N-acetyltransferase